MIQIDMDMPSDCVFCPMIQRYIFFSGKRWYCGISKKEVNDIFKRPKSCPLIEVIEVKDGEQK